MKQKHTFFVTVGIPSLFLIFSVLCLCVLALLTLNRSRTGMSAAQHSLEQTKKYYNACSKATETVTEIRDSLTGYASDSSNESEYFAQVQAFADSREDFSWDPSAHTLAFSAEMTDTQQLSVILEILYPQDNNSDLLRIRQWSTYLTDTWKPDNHQNVFKGE